MTLGGRVAEEIVIGDISAGASNDIQVVSKRARAMVTEWGMSDRIGPISYGSDKELFIGRDMQSHVTYSEEIAGVIDEEVRSIIMNALETARKLLTKNVKLLHNMARLLVERETIFSEEVDMLMEGKSVEEIMLFMDENERNLAENPFARKASGVIVKDEEVKAKAPKAKPAKEKAPKENEDGDGESKQGEEIENQETDSKE
jgi:cell division protease FtsH